MFEISEVINRVHNADCLEFMRELPDGCVDCVITDPPFFAPAIHYQSRISWGRCWGDLSILGQAFYDWCLEFKRILNLNGHLFVFCHDESYPVFYPVAYGLWDFTSALVWNKTRVGLGKIFRHQFELILWASNRGASVNNNGKLHSDILSYEATPSILRNHPVQKPIGLIQELLEVCSNENDLILDPFLGSGTTVVAAKQLGRNFIGVEINPEYCRIAEERLKQEILPFNSTRPIASQQLRLEES